MMENSNLEIKKIEKLLFKNNETFSDSDNKYEGSRIRIIKNWNSCDVSACPGSGKTTVLLAKLALLANRMPFTDGKGICVLTHTNVAIDEIKNRIGNKSDVLFRYPSYFGTIQSFVDKFLAIPYFISKFHKRPIAIDNSKYFSAIDKEFLYYIKGFTGQETKNAKYYCMANNLLYSFRIDPMTLKLLNHGKELVIKKPKRGKNYNDFSDIEKEKIILWLKKLKCNVMNRQMILSFDDSYFLALRYLIDFPEIKNYFISRFKYVFIDEMQDTDELQNNLLAELFDKEKIVVQKYGDPFQAIYDSGNSRSIYQWKPENPLIIDNSKRFGPNISKVLNTVCIENNHYIGDNENDLKPYIILYDDDSIEKVKEKFAEVIVCHELHEIEKPIFKAVGWVSDKTKKLKISDYCSTYNKNINSKKNTYTNLFSYIYYIKKLNSEMSSEYFNFFLNMFAHILKLADVKDDNGKYFSVYSLQEYLKQNNEYGYLDFRKRIYIWARRIKYCNLRYLEKFKDRIENYIKNEFSALWNNFDLIAVNSFLLNTEIDDISEDNVDTGNIYKAVINGNEINIEFGTIHSVKGETHTATLYLETFYYDYECNRLKYYICGDHENSNGRLYQNLKMAYVGMSRPKYLLCVALHKDRIGCLNCAKMNRNQSNGECNWIIDDSLVKS